MRVSIPTILLAAVMVLPSLAQEQPQYPPRPAATPEVGANLPAQPVGPNDLIAVSVYDAPELSRTVRIGADGFFRLPMLKQRIKAQGLLPADLETAIAAALREEQILVDPFVTVTIAEYHSRPITVNGAVKMPLVFQAVGPTTLLDALARAQGLNENAGTEILVSEAQMGPDNKPVTLTRRVPVRSLIDEADPAFNLMLYGGEEVRVPEVGRIYVVGNVKKPGAFPVRNGGGTTVLEMIAVSEGLAPYYTNEAYIYRQEGAGNKNEIPVPLEKIMQRKAPDVPLMANDILYIPDAKGKRLTLGTLEKISGVGAVLGAAAIYVMR
ncbi:MAG TPA: polysaccharide biosynthesis/export family protein [Bryobacteraceae bacterium]|nr:polysaccharide biosynthesis/export family protein [Bryobacteraceae bacterium]